MTDALCPEPDIPGPRFLIPVYIRHCDAAAGVVLVDHRLRTIIDFSRIHVDGPASRQYLFHDPVILIGKLVGKATGPAAPHAAAEQDIVKDRQPKPPANPPLGPFPLQSRQIRGAFRPIDHLCHIGIQRRGDALQHLHVRQGLPRFPRGHRLPGNVKLLCQLLLRHALRRPKPFDMGSDRRHRLTS